MSRTPGQQRMRDLAEERCTHEEKRLAELPDEEGAAKACWGCLLDAYFEVCEANHVRRALQSAQLHYGDS